MTRSRSGDRASYTRTDQGWADGMHPLDAFVKTTQELLGPLHAATAYDRLTRFEFLTPDRSVRRATYGQGDAATTVVVNFGESDATVTTRARRHRAVAALGTGDRRPTICRVLRQEVGRKRAIRTEPCLRCRSSRGRLSRKPASCECSTALAIRCSPGKTRTMK